MADIPDYGDPKDVKEAVQRTHVPGMSEAIRRAGLEPARGDVSPVFERATNQVISEVEQARLRRRAEFLRRQDASMASPRSRGDAIVASHMPEGGRIVRGQNVQLGGGNSGNLYTAPIPYNYPYESPERDWYPESRTVQVKVSRQVAADNGLIATCMDILSELPYSEFDLKGDGIDGSVKRTYEEMVDRTGLVNMCQTGTRELYITGEAPLHGLWDSTHGMWRRFHLHPSDQLTVYDMPVLMNEPIVEWTPPVAYKTLLNIDHPQMRKNRLAIPPDVLRAIENGESITLEPAAFTLIARKNAPDCARGTSILTRLWRAIVYEDAIFHAAIQTARRLASPLKIAKLGDPGSDYFPTEDQERALKEALAQAELDVGCFTPRTPVSLVDGSCKSAGELRVGDQVISRLGRREVVEAMQIEHAPELVRLSVVGAQEIECTTTHKWPIWGGPRTCMCGCDTKIKSGNFARGHGLTGLGKKHEYWIPTGCTKRQKGAGKPFRFLKGFSPYQKVTADQIREGDYLLIPRTFDEVQPPGVTVDHARLLGLYAAEGNRRTEPRAGNRTCAGVELSFCIDEKDTLVKDTLDIVERLCGYRPQTREIPERHSLQVRLNRDASNDLCLWLEAHAGKHAAGKKFSADVMQWPLSLKYELLKAFAAGDGSSVAKKRNPKQRYVEIGSASLALIDQLRLIGVQLGSYGSIHHGIQPESSFGAGNPFYRLNFFGEFAAKLSKDAWGFDAEVPVKSQQWWVDDHFVYVRVRGVERVQNLDGSPFEVINLQISGDHSYVAGGFATYNSWITWSWAINFELVGVQERVLPITQHMPLVEQMILSAFGINKALILGEASYNSASAGLTIILQRLLAMRNLFTKKWLIPKVFGMMAVANDWVLRSPAEIQHGLRIKRSPQETKYIIPDIVWRKALDSNIDSEKIQAMAALRDLGARYSQKSLHTLSGTDFQEETDQIIRETRYRRQAAGADAGLLAALGGGEENAPGGGGGGMIGSPGIAPPVGGGGGGAEAPPDMGGAVPPDMGGGEPAPGGNTGAPPADGAQAAGPRGKPQPTQPSGDKEHGLPKEFIEAGVRFLATLNPEEARDVAPWDEILEDPMVKEAMDSQDPGEVWDAVETSFAEMGLPPQAIAAISDTLTSRAKKLAKAAYAGQRRIARTGKRPLVTMHENTTKVLQMVNRNKLQREIQELDATAGIDLYTGSSD